MAAPDVDKNLTFLIVDDFATMRKIVKNALNKMGVTKLFEAEDGAKALARVKEGGIDFIISDWNMPNMMGIDFLKAVRSDDKSKAIPFLMVTAEGQKENVMEAVQAGVSNYIVKPFTAETLEDKIKGVLNRPK